MGRPCTCCASPQRGLIDAGLIAGVSAETLARQFGVSGDAIGRHRAHLPAGGARHEAPAHGLELVTQVKQLHGKAVSLLLAAEKAGDLRGAIGGIRECARTLELLGKLQGQLGQGDTTINIVSSPVFVGLQTTIMMALEAHPDARAAVVRALGQTTIEG